MTACQLVRSKIDHTRHGKPSHFLSRKGLSIWINLDSLPEASRLSALFSVDRFNLLSFFQSDYGPNFGSTGQPQNLASYARDLMRQLLPDTDVATVHLLTFPRIMGVAFNPVSIYVMRDHSGHDLAYIYEVRNTFGDMHSYVGRADGDASMIEVDKIFHVSPFFPVEGGYRLRVRASDADGQVAVLMRYTASGEPRLTATLRGRREKLTTLSVAKSLLMTGQWPLRPLVSIHVEALRLWLKKVPFFSRPAPPQPWSRARNVPDR